MKTNNCIFTVLTNDFFMGFEVFIKSLLCHNPGFNYDFIICDVNMNEAQRSRALQLYPKIKFIKPDFSKYKIFNHAQTPQKYFNCNYIYELFKLDYDTVVAFDIDMLVCDSIQPLLEIKEAFSMCRCYRARTDTLMDKYNSGLLVVKKPLLTEKIYTDLLNLASKPNRGGDQEIFNMYFKNAINEIPKKYNIEKRYFYTKNKKKFKKDVSIIHFVGVKPWQIRLKNEDRFHEWESVWWNWYSRDKICVRNAKFAKIGLIRMLSWIWNARGGTDLKDLDMIEIGSYAGDSSEIFAQNVSEILCVDPYENGYDDNDDSSNKISMGKVFKIFCMKRALFTNILNKKSKSINYSKIINKNCVDMVYIDGLHTYEGCKQDIQAWLPKIREGGFLAGHDYGSRHFPGVRQAVDELLGKPDAVFEDTSWVKKKT